MENKAIFTKINQIYDMVVKVEEKEEREKEEKEKEQAKIDQQLDNTNKGYYFLLSLFKTIDLLKLLQEEREQFDKIGKEIYEKSVEFDQQLPFGSYKYYSTFYQCNSIELLYGKVQDLPMTEIDILRIKSEKFEEEVLKPLYAQQRVCKEKIQNLFEVIKEKTKNTTTN